MARKIEQFSRIIQHRITGEGVNFTIPTSNDHTDETWSSRDLYIGEIGINVTDNKMYYRTNNGIVEVATSTVATASTIWQISDNTVQIGTAHAPESIVRNTNSFVDLGSSSLRFKDLYLGGAANSSTIINTNGNFTIKTGSDIISTIAGSGTDALLLFATQSSNTAKSIPVQIVSQNSSVLSSTNAVIIASKGSQINQNSTRCAIIGGNDVKFADNLTNTVFLGDSKGKTFSQSSTIGLGGKTALRGVSDDGSGCYLDSDYIQGQQRLTTSDALTLPIFTYVFDYACGEVISCKFLLTGIDAQSADRVYSADIFVTLSFDGTGRIICDPIIKEVNTIDGAEVSIVVNDVIVTNDDYNFSLFVKGEPTTIIKWLLTYEYHKIINIC
jgi:hypothetical protein